jgi:hypothetical protein
VTNKASQLIIERRFVPAGMTDTYRALDLAAFGSLKASAGAEHEKLVAPTHVRA